MRLDAELVAETFGLGDPIAPPFVAAAGWGQRNLVWRLETDSGVFAVKDCIPELLPSDPASALLIEGAAHAAGVPCPEQFLSRGGRTFELLEGRWYRCHRWVAGSTKQNHDTTPHDAYEMGGIVAKLHQARIDPGTGPEPAPFGRSRWLDLAAQSPTSQWSDLVRDNIDVIVANDILGANSVEQDTVGTHRDLNAHNVLFTVDGLCIIDWDAAGPESARYERASTAVLWAQREAHRYDLDVARQFMRAYRDHGGVTSSEDADSLTRWLAGLAWWTERNLQIAVAHASRAQDELASQLVGAMIVGIETVTARQQFLLDVYARL